jgi:hypothetical protein
MDTNPAELGAPGRRHKLSILKVSSDFLLVQSFNRSLRFIRIRHFHESEPTGTTCFPFGNDADLRYLTETAESLSNLFFRRAERKVPYKNIRH